MSEAQQSATILEFKPRPRQQPIGVVSVAEKPASPGALKISEWDCDLMDAVKARADHALDVVNMGQAAAESFLHDELRMQTTFKFGQSEYRLVLQLEQINKPRFA
jgi:hypothetical protein